MEHQEGVTRSRRTFVSPYKFFSVLHRYSPYKYSQFIQFHLCVKVKKVVETDADDDYDDKENDHADAGTTFSSESLPPSTATNNKIDG